MKKKELTFNELKKLVKESADDGEVITTDMIVKKLVNHSFFKNYMRTLEFRMAEAAANNIVYGTKMEDWDPENESQYVFKRIQHIAEVLVKLMERDGLHLAIKDKQPLQ